MHKNLHTLKQFLLSLILKISFSLCEPRLRKVKVCRDLLLEGTLPHTRLEHVDSNSSCPTENKIKLVKIKSILNKNQ